MMRDETRDKLRMLWLDLSVSPHGIEVPEEFRQSFELIRSHGADLIVGEVDEVSPDVICLDYDYPDRAGLQFAVRIKARFPSVPIIMATIQHSEELAVWAFRNRLADFLVKPIAHQEFRQCHERLMEMSAARRQQRSRKIHSSLSDLPSGAVAVPRIGDKKFLPAIYHVSKNFAEKISNAEAANLCAMSPFRFSRGFKEAFGINFHDYLVKYRLRMAFTMLRSADASISDVAFAVGFNDASYFSRMFKRHFGVCPSSLVDDPSEDLSATKKLEIPAELIRQFSG